jgi:DNA repair protein RecO (recombination protein O)
MTSLITEGLVLREVLYRDSDKMLTILTKDRGKLSASCPGARSRRSSMRAGTQLLAYSTFTLYENRGRYSIDAAEPVELFIGIRKDIVPLSLASYIAEVLETVADEEDPSPEILATGLNCLYALSVRKKPQALIKAVFETRIIMLAGYAPDVSSCSVCGKTDMADPVLDIKTGMAGCAGCVGRGPGIMPLCGQSLLALRYILTCEPKRILSFSLEERPLALLSQASEQYLLSRLERDFQTLAFYKSILT